MPKRKDSDNNVDDESELENDFQRLQEKLEKKMKTMNEKAQKLREETEAVQIMKETMGSVIARNIRDDDIIKINAGGKFVIETNRSTLCLAEGTVFSNMFSGRWEDSLQRDEQGRVFLDHDPTLIEVIVNFMRLKKIEDPSRPVPSPSIPHDKKVAFRLLLHYFGLTDFFYGPRLLDVSNLNVVQSNGSKVDVTRKDNKMQFTYNRNGHYFVACTPSLVSFGEGSSWKVTVDTLPDNKWIYLGIIGNINPQRTSNSYAESSSNGWANGYYVYRNGSSHKEESGWTSFVQGECLYFHLQSNKLFMFSAKKNKTFVITDIMQNNGTKYYIHFNFHGLGTKLTLEPLSSDEFKCIHP